MLPVLASAETDDILAIKQREQLMTQTTDFMMSYYEEAWPDGRDSNRTYRLL